MKGGQNKMIINIFYEIYNYLYNFFNKHQIIVIILIEIGFLAGMYLLEKMQKMYEKEERCIKNDK